MRHIRLEGIQRRPFPQNTPSQGFLSPHSPLVISASLSPPHLLKHNKLVSPTPSSTQKIINWLMYFARHEFGKVLPFDPQTGDLIGEQLQGKSTSAEALADENTEVEDSSLTPHSRLLQINSPDRHEQRLHSSRK